MNDFTKDELQYLFKTFLLTNSDKFEHELERKIQSMIESYCEHEYGKGKYHCIDCGVSEYSCSKCAHISYEGLE